MFSINDFNDIDSGIIKMQDLYNKRNDVETKECISFEYALEVYDENNIPYDIRFYFNRLEQNLWSVNFISKKHSIGELKAYSCEYQVQPQQTLPMVAATGLVHIQLILQEEVQYKSMVELSIGNCLYRMR